MLPIIPSAGDSPPFPLSLLSLVSTSRVTASRYGLCPFPCPYPCMYAYSWVGVVQGRVRGGSDRSRWAHTYTVWGQYRALGTPRWLRSRRGPTGAVSPLQNAFRGLLRLPILSRICGRQWKQQTRIAVLGSWISSRGGIRSQMD